MGGSGRWRGRDLLPVSVGTATSNGKAEISINVANSNAGIRTTSELRLLIDWNLVSRTVQDGFTHTRFC